MKFISSIRTFFVIAGLIGAALIYDTLLNRSASVSGSWWFLALGAAASLNTAACAASRAKTAPRWFLPLHAGVFLVLAGGFISLAKRHKFTIPLQTGYETTNGYEGETEVILPFSVKLLDFKVEYYGEPKHFLILADGKNKERYTFKSGDNIKADSLGAGIKILRTVKDFGVTGDKKVVERSPYYFNPAAQLEITRGGKTIRRWVFCNFPDVRDGTMPFDIIYEIKGADIKNFASLVELKNPAGNPQETRIKVNSPAGFGGFKLHQIAYDPANPSSSILLASKDPGINIVYAGFASFIIGILLWI